MKTKFYLNYNKTTKANVIEIVGTKRFNQMIKEAKEDYSNDSNIQIEYSTSKGQLVIEFN
ncbi:hypothetical protein [Clostridium sp.]|uniref:hypothetical protein n=1 Tax=Clostridium sp. TaxID=1506 RepID=UPI001A3EF56D|nr:hypothetical protein [Clostridium sp.]MBK5234064.1 hypothetical protein [Clostridium sp.]